MESFPRLGPDGVSSESQIETQGDDLKERKTCNEKLIDVSPRASDGVSSTDSPTSIYLVSADARNGERERLVEVSHESYLFNVFPVGEYWRQ